MDGAPYLNRPLCVVRIVNDHAVVVWCGRWRLYVVCQLLTVPPPKLARVVRVWEPPVLHMPHVGSIGTIGTVP